MTCWQLCAISGLVHTSSSSLVQSLLPKDSLLRTYLWSGDVVNKTRIFFKKADILNRSERYALYTCSASGLNSIMPFILH